jgi:hypothetical protein
LANRNRDLNSEFTSRQKEVNGITDKAEKANAQRELNEWKTNTTKEINEWKTNANADFSKWKTESTADLTNFNKDRVRELGEIQSNQKNDLANWQKERDAGLADINKDITERQALRNFDNSVFKSGYTGFNSEIAGDDLGALNKGYDTEIGKQKSEADKAKAALAAAARCQTPPQPQPPPAGFRSPGRGPKAVLCRARRVPSRRGRPRANRRPDRRSLRGPSPWSACSEPGPSVGP